jgi:MFS transporter, DHA1 family, multidrug resistance protein
MPALFAVCAIALGCTSYLNSRWVDRIGMRIISHAALLAFFFLALLHVFIALLHTEPIWAFTLIQSGCLACYGLAVSNFGAMAMEPLGAVAGIGASLLGFICQFFSALIGALIGWQFRGTIMPLAAGTLGCSVAALVFALLAENGRLFRRDQGPAMDSLGVTSSVL